MTAGRCAPAPISAGTRSCPGNGTLAEQVAAIVAGGGQRFYDTGGQKATLNALTGIFNPQYKVNQNVTVYGLVGRGEKAGAVNTGAQAIFVGNAFQNSSR
ncbi:hypothetical protein IY145_02030 [Methylosinus sp. H3A]|uniref:hypothetical protein n=1 Tax=Methylosinus sp. H3A TaxID=2785786 RepID=UPI0018C1E237|nr:hypothetical protein [Methylosinus sp. H3A]MBG0808187.1 hypothetical protein [Methylosinus sp. H3A]